MITALIVVGAILAYLAIGAWVAVASIPALWKRGERLGWHGAYARPAVVRGAVARALFWPVMLPYELLARRVDALNPAEVQRRNEEMRSRIAELEHELGIGDHS